MNIADRNNLFAKLNKYMVESAAIPGIAPGHALVDVNTIVQLIERVREQDRQLETYRTRGTKLTAKILGAK